MFDENLNALFVGFRANEPHLFVISGPGNITYCDAQGYAAIGSGAFAAQMSLERHPYDRNKPMAECIYAVIAAKFAAESADGVGPDSAVYVYNSKARQKMRTLSLKPERLEELKQQWKDLPKIPIGVVNDLEIVYRSPKRVRRLTRSNAQTLEGQK